MASKFSRETLLFLARLAQQCERHYEMLEFIEIILQTHGDLSVEERAMLSAGFKSIVGNRRAEVRVLSALEQREFRSQSSSNSLQLTRNYKKNILNEIQDYCNKAINLVDNVLLPNAKQIDSRVFYLKMKADYYRYLCEYQNDEFYSDSIEKAHQSYREADNLAKNNLASTNPIRLGLMLNLSVFYYEILGKQEDAVRIASHAFDEAVANIDNVNEENYKDCTLIIGLLRDNLTLWNESQEQNHEG